MSGPGRKPCPIVAPSGGCGSREALAHPSTSGETQNLDKAPPHFSKTFDQVPQSTFSSLATSHQCSSTCRREDGLFYEKALFGAVQECVHRVDLNEICCACRPEHLEGSPCRRSFFILPDGSLEKSSSLPVSPFLIESDFPKLFMEIFWRCSAGCFRFYDNIGIVIITIYFS